MKRDFNHFIEKGKKHQKTLNEIYKANVGLVNNIKTLSKYYMDQLANVDSGLDVKEGMKKVNENLKELVSGIANFNQKIEKSCEDFTDEIEKLFDSYDQAAELYQAKEGELTSFLTTRREILYLEALIIKFKLKINSLQLMNNALFSFSSEFKDVKDAYKSNLITISTVMQQASESCRNLILKIESLN
ncbi:MAG: hypothetical protein RJQ00_03980 [Vicingaceae bacterium]